MPSLSDRLNDLLDTLVEDGCYDHAQILVDILEDNDLLREDAVDDYVPDFSDTDQER